MRYYTIGLAFLMLLGLVACGQNGSTPAPDLSPTAVIEEVDGTEEVDAVETAVSPSPSAPSTPLPLLLDGADENLAAAYHETIRFGRALIAEDIGIDSSLLAIAEIEIVEWPDGCLGLGQPNEACTEALVPGLRVRITYLDQIYELRTDIDGRQYRWGALQ